MSLLRDRSRKTILALKKVIYILREKIVSYDQKEEERLVCVSYFLWACCNKPLLGSESKFGGRCS